MIDCAKVTSVKEYGFNSMEGYTYIGVIKFILKNGRYKLVRTEFNSTYLGDEDTPEDYLEKVLEGMFNAVEQSNKGWVNITCLFLYVELLLKQFRKSRKKS